MGRERIFEVPNNDGGTGWHYEYDVLYEELEAEQHGR